MARFRACGQDRQGALEKTSMSLAHNEMWETSHCERCSLGESSVNLLIYMTIKR